MSVKRASTSNIGSTPDYSMNRNSWVRPTDWVAIPDILPSETKVAYLLSIYDTDNEWNAITCSTTSGNYTVDWGDGTVTSHATGIKAERKYDYTAAVTSTYGAVTTRGYRTVLVVITGNLNSIDFTVVPTGFASIATRKQLDIIASIPNIGAISGGSGDCLVERFIQVSGQITSGGFTFAGCRQLQAISKLTFSSSLTFLAYTFANCVKLEYCPEITGMTVTDSSTLGVSNIFLNCSSLKECPILPTSPSISIVWDSAYSGCVSLKTIKQPLIKAKAMTSTFYGCTNLEKINSIFELSACTAIASAFLNTPNLRTIPPLNTSTLLTNVTSAFQNSGIDTSVELVTDNVTVFNSLYAGCSNLKKIIHSYNINNALNVSSIVNGCSSLVEFTSNIFTGTWKSSFAAGGFATMFSACGNIRSISVSNGAIPATVTSFSALPTNTVLTKVNWSGINQTFSISNNSFSATELNNLYTSLATVTAKTITVTGNPGTATDTPSIATAKGWTVTG